MRKKILLVMPGTKLTDRLFRYIKFPPYSLFVLHALTPKRYEIRIIDEPLQEEDYCWPDLIGISVSSLNLVAANDISRRFRENGKLVVMGGPHPTFFPDACLNHCDSIVIGNAENVWLRLLKDFEEGKLKKKYASKSPPKKIPIVSYEALNGQGRGYINVFNATRGCSNKCEFCCVHKLNPFFIKRPIKDVIQEIRKNKGKFIGRFFFLIDDNIFSDREYAMSLFKAIKKERIYWFCSAPTSIGFDDKLLDLLYESGCRILSVGIETFNEETLKKIRKPNKPSEYSQLIRKMKGKGFLVYGLFIAGFDEDTKGYLMNMKYRIHDTGVDFLNIGPLIPTPGSDLFNRLKQEGRLFNNLNEGSHYNLSFKHKNISNGFLRKTIRESYSHFYSLRNIFLRLFNQKFSLENLLIFFVVSMSYYFSLGRIKRIYS